jgi:hypothetical protein
MEDEMDKRVINRLSLLCETVLADNADTGHLLKTHLFTERLLDELIMDCLGLEVRNLKRLDLRYTAKISLAESLAVLPPECATSLRRLNALRNTCVHTLNMRPGVEQIHKIIADITDELPGIANTTTVKALLERYLACLCGYLFPGTIENASVLADTSDTRH